MDRIANAVTLQLSREAVEGLVQLAFPGKGPSGVTVDLLEPGRSVVRMAYKPWMLRPGNVLSGPTLMTAADLGMYVLVLAHLGPDLMAVTADMNLRFINKAVPGDVVCETKLLKLGSKLVVMDSRVWSSNAPDVIAMAASGSYVQPSKRPAKPAA